MGDQAYGDDGRNETLTERADRNWNDVLQEVRVAQTCTQIIGGFLLAVAFQPRFEELDDFQLALYLVLVALAGLATALGIAVVGLHRAYFGRRQKARVVALGSRLLVATLVVVALLASGVTGLVFDFVLSRSAGLIALALSLAIVAALGLGLPVMSRARAGEPTRFSEPHSPASD